MHEASKYQVPADRSLAHQLSSAQQHTRSASSAAQRRAVSCGAVPAVQRGTVQSWVVLCRVACFAAHNSFVQRIIRYIIPGTRYQYYTRFVRTALLLNHKKCTPNSQLNPAIAQQCSAAPCGDVRCRALPCGAVLCRAALCIIISNIQHQVCITRRYLVPTDVLVFVLFDSYLGRLCFIFRKLHPSCRSEIAHRYTAQHKAISCAQVALGKSLLL